MAKAFSVNELLTNTFLGHLVRFNDIDTGDWVEGEVTDVFLCKSGVKFTITASSDDPNGDYKKGTEIDAMCSDESVIEILN